MEYRKIGATGMSVSSIGLGAEHLDNKPYEVVEETIRSALDVGMNMMDVFMPGEEVRSYIGRALGADREKFIIQGHIGSVDLSQQYDISRDLATCKKYFENLLRCLRTDYIDFGMLFFIDGEEALTQIYENGIVDYAQQLKKQGTIRAIGASSHDPVTAYKLVESGLVDLLMFSINPAFDMTPANADVLATLNDSFGAQQYENIDTKRADLYRLCEKKGVAITVMKTLGGGRLLRAEHSPFKKELSVGQCVHYALTRPAVVSALLGCQSKAEVEEAVRYYTLSAEEKDYSKIVGGYKGDYKGNCVYCNHCLPCPVGIDIASANRYLDIAMTEPENIPPSIRQHYTSMAAGGADCIACGSCEAKCPFDVPVIQKMEQAAELFGR